MTASVVSPENTGTVGGQVLRIGSLCSGYGGLDMAVQHALGGEVSWHAENDPDASKVLAHRYPGVPNLGDITKTNWEDVARVDLVTAGFPCQPFSAAGRRQGYQDERWLWDDVARAIAALRPSLVVLENVPGLFTTPGRQPDCVCGWNLRWGGQLGDLLYDHEWADQVLAADGGSDGQAARPERPRRYVRRPIGAGDSAGAGECGDAAMGNVGDGGGLSAVSHAPAPHREASAGAARAGDAPAGVAAIEERPRDRMDAAGLKGMGGGEGADWRAELAWDGDHGRVDCPACGRPVDDSAERPVRRAVEDVLRSVAGLGFDASWCTLRASDVGAPHQRRRWFLIASAADTAHLGHERGGRARGRRPGSADGGGPAADAHGDGCTRRQERDRGAPPRSEVQPRDDADGCVLEWGAYESAIRRWEAILGRPAPRPTEPGANGQPRLTPLFVEWLMGLPAGWVTDVPGLSRNAQLKALGNGVVPQQCAAGLGLLLDRMEVAA